MSRAGADSVTVFGSTDLPNLRDAWDQLADRCPGRYLSQGWRWRAASWYTVAAPRGRTLRILALRSADRLVAIWPLVTYRTRRLAIVRPLGPESSEYDAPLVEPGPDALERTARIFRAAARFGDLMFLPHVRQDEAFGQFIRSHRFHAYEDDVLDTPWLARDDYPHWPDYLASVSPSRLAGLRRKRRRLEEQAALSFAVERAPIPADEIARLLADKQRWMAERGLSNAWLETPEYRAFLTALTSGTDSRDGLTLFALRLAGRTIAAQLNAVDARRVEFLIGAFDAEWSRYSPGELLMQECLRWAFEHGLDFDFRIGD